MALILSIDAATEKASICISNNEKIITKKLHFRFERNLNVQLTAVNALNMLREFILEN